MVASRPTTIDGAAPLSGGPQFLSHPGDTVDGEHATRATGPRSEPGTARRTPVRTTGNGRKVRPRRRMDVGRQAGARVRALVIISTIAVLLVLLLASAVSATGAVAATESYRVRPGDTLWEIAREQGPADADPRVIVDAIRRINRLDGVLIRPGEILEVPAG